jgi:signal transduction histidine kinase
MSTRRESESAAVQQPIPTALSVDQIVEQARALVNDDPRAALPVALEALSQAEQIDYPQGRGHALGSIGYAHYLLSDLEKALDYSTRGLEILEEVDDLRGQCDILGGLAMTHRSLGNYEESFALGLKGIKIIQGLDDKKMEAWWTNGLGGGFEESGDFQRALQYHEEALRLFQEVGEPLGVARAKTGIGTVYQHLGKWEDAERCHREALDAYRENGNRLGEARALNDLGLVLQHHGDFDSAREFHQQSLALREEVGNRQAQATSLINLGRLYLLTDQPEEAQGVLHRALFLAMEIGSKPRIFQANEILSQAYRRTGDFESALSHFEEFHRVKEEISGDVAATRIKNIQIGFEVESSQQEAEIERLRNVELKGKNDQLRTLLEELSAAQSQLVQSEKMAALGNLVAGVVHELNSPVGALGASADIVSRCAARIASQLSTEDQSGTEMQKTVTALSNSTAVIAQAVNRITRISQGLKSFVYLDQASFQDVDVQVGLDTTLDLLAHQVGKKVEVVRQYGNPPKVRCHPAELNQVYMHLTQNALTAMGEEGRLCLTTSADPTWVSIAVSDTGSGIPPEELEGLFEPGFSRKGTRVKAGMGLFTSDHIVRQHGGRIDVTSQPGRGSTFTIRLPVAR